MASNGDSLVREGIKAYRDGNKDEARNLLLQAVEVDDQNEQAWMWLSAVVDTAEDQQTCLENVLTINPNNEKARQGLQILSEKASDGAAVTSPPPASPTSPPPVEDDDPFAQVSFTQTEPTAPPPAPAIEDEEDEDELPSDTQWGTIETSSASALPQAKIEPSADEYDDWVAGLNLGSGDAAQLFGDVQAGSNDDSAFSASPFIGAESLFGEEPDSEDDDNPFGVSDDLLPTEAALSSDNDDDDAFSARSFMIDTDFDEENDKELFDEAPALSPPSPETQIAEDSFFDDLGDDEGFDEDQYDDFDDAEFDDVDPEELFRFIPAEIKATRMPGTRERYPVPVILGLVLLILFNIGAITSVFITLTGG